MAKLKAKQRNALPSSAFAGPNRSFPIPDASHARQALRERKFAPDPAAIVSKVKANFPGIQPRALGGPVMPGQPYMVGEQGPEVITPRMPGMVAPNAPRLPGTPGVMGRGIPNPLRGAMAGMRGPQGPTGPKVRAAVPRPKGIRGTTDFKALMGKLNGRM